MRNRARSIDNAIAVTNARGGVLKTSLVANIAGLAAQGGWRVLVIDADPQGSLVYDFVVADTADHGQHLASVIESGNLPVPVASGRQNLDMIAGGRFLEPVSTQLAAAGAIDLAARERLIDTLQPISTNYDLVLFDTPPVDAGIRRLIGSVARFTIVPTAPDAASIEGLRNLLSDQERFEALDPRNELLVVTLGPVAANTSQLRRDARRRLAQIFDRYVPVAMATIRAAQKVAVDCRNRGQLVIEYEAEATSRSRRRTSGRTYASAAIGLADDYHALTDEILARFVDRRTTPDHVSVYP